MVLVAVLEVLLVLLLAVRERMQEEQAPQVTLAVMRQGEVVVEFSQELVEHRKTRAEPPIHI